MIIYHDYLQCVNDVSSKYFRLVLAQEGGTFSADTTYGKIGVTAVAGPLYSGPDRAAAEAAYRAKLKSKLGGEYSVAPDPAGGGGEPMAPALIAAMTAKSGPKSALPLVPAQLAGQRGNLAAALAAPARFAIEEKFDGHRGMLRLSDGAVTLLNRHGRDEGRIKNTPALAQAAKAWADASPALWAGTILDGEMYGGSLSGTAHLLGSAGRTDTRLRYIVFDAPFLGGVDQRKLPWAGRRAALEAAMRGAPAPFEISALLAPTRSVVEDIWARGGEGVVIKDRNAPYSSGDRSSWTKVKQASTAEGVVLGFTEGRGENAGAVGSVRLGQYRGGKLVEVCAVGGMTDSVRATLRRDLVVGKTVVEFKYRPIEGSRERYTEPRWLRVRDDKEPEDCVWEES